MVWRGDEGWCEGIIRLSKNNRWRVNRLTGLTHPITPCLRMTFLCVVVIDGVTGHETGQGGADQKKPYSKAKC